MSVHHRDVTKVSFSAPTQKLTAHEVIYFYVFKGLHNGAEFKSWTMANKDRLQESDICSFIHSFIWRLFLLQLRPPTPTEV